MKYVIYTILGLTVLIGISIATSPSNNLKPGQLNAYEQCYVNSLRAAAARFEKDTRTYYTVTEEEVVALAKANARLECAGK
ncbi:MAG: hypothetical protein EOO81_05230 [Oxalobacteraceae bacterium]|nr:MAG: hypothetical protein EOO81_05230 [Oxalobacteraceae bacterium]